MTEFIKDADIKSLVAEKDVERLIEVLERGGTRAMQMEAATALGELRDTRAIPALLKMGGMTSGTGSGRGLIQSPHWE